MNDLRKAAEMALEALECAYKGKDRTGQVIDAIVALEKALRQALDDKPPVKSYAGGKPNYCTPQPEVCCGEYARCLKVCIPKERWFAQQKLNVDAVNMSEEHVDKTAKSEHEPVAWADKVGAVIPHSHKLFQPDLLKDYTRPLYTAPPKREWVGLSDVDRVNLCGMIFGGRFLECIDAIEAKLKEKNT